MRETSQVLASPSAGEVLECVSNIPAIGGLCKGLVSVLPDPKDWQASENKEEVGILQQLQRTCTMVDRHQREQEISKSKEDSSTEKAAEALQI